MAAKKKSAPEIETIDVPAMNRESDRPSEPVTHSQSSALEAELILPSSEWNVDELSKYVKARFQAVADLKALQIRIGRKGVQECLLIGWAFDLIRQKLEEVGYGWSQWQSDQRFNRGTISRYLRFYKAAMDAAKDDIHAALELVGKHRSLDAAERALGIVKEGKAITVPTRLEKQDNLLAEIEKELPVLLQEGKASPDEVRQRLLAMKARIDAMLGLVGD